MTFRRLERALGLVDFSQLVATAAEEGRMTHHSLAAILQILELEPAHDATRVVLERIVRKARLAAADTEVPEPPAPVTTRSPLVTPCHGGRVVLE